MSTSRKETLPVSQKPIPVSPAVTTDATWYPLYLVGAATALLTVVCILIAIPVFLLWPPPGGLLPVPSTVIDSFTLLQKNWLVGLLDFDLIILVSTILMVPIYLALYVSLRRVSPSFMAIALVFGLIGGAAYFAVNPAFSMLSLSTQYAAATSDAQRAPFVAAGLALLASYQGTGFDVYYFLSAVSTLIISAVMLRSTIFSKTTAAMGLAAGILMIVPPTIGVVGLYLSLLSLLPLVIWDLLIAQRLARLAQGKK